ncbi:mitogen-activated protein kinase kinase kinase 13 isoform X2 [Lepeophtheirus salmonis]|uniref:mitogen-activated protein kinase kinase kinase 13 isoform X2 n=2 Tax=Lepeophtheirus salmonis TaxID=72036 RepID=UPI001AE5AD4B|nr:mitogen-activated protein kinase kinase kinase 13-B-like isoform X2 [Lepeophtheirus salmonis]
MKGGITRMGLCFSGFLKSKKSKMVITSSTETSIPVPIIKRGMTLPGNGVPINNNFGGGFSTVPNSPEDQNIKTNNNNPHLRLSSLPNSDNEIFSFANSALHLNDDDSIHLSLSPDNINEDSDSSNSNNNSNKGTWYDGFFGCLKPVLSMMGKQKPVDKSEDDWEIPFEHISNLEWLGSGAQGAVFVGKLHSEYLAVKKVKEVAETNIYHLRHLNHPNIVQFLGVCTQSPVYAILMEYCPYGPLFYFLRDGKDKVPPKRLVAWTKQIASGMKYLHDNKIIHRDLKSPNVLIGRKEIIKISDFGTSRTWTEQSTYMSFAGTVAWMAPEVIRNEPCSEKVDIWSFGVCLWELLTCEVPYKNVDSSAVIWGVGSNSLQLPIPSTCPEGFKLLIKQCWSPKPRNRPSFKHILMHLDIAAVEILSFLPEDYFRTQQSWKLEVWEYNERMKAEDTKMIPLAENAFLLRRRKEELKHAQDVKELYERKLQKVNNLYLELSAWKLQLEEKEKILNRRAQQINCQNSKVYYKKKLRPILNKAQERLRKKAHLPPAVQIPQPRSQDILSTSPDSPLKRIKQSSFKFPTIDNKLENSCLECSCVRNQDKDSSDTKTYEKKICQKEVIISSDQYHPSPEQLKKCRKLKMRKRSGNNAHTSPQQIIRQSHKFKDIHYLDENEPMNSEGNSESGDESSISLIYDDYLETLDRKVSKIINRKPSFTINLDDELHRSHSDRFYGPLSFNYRAPPKTELSEKHNTRSSSLPVNDGNFFHEGDDEDSRDDSSREDLKKDWPDQENENSDNGDPVFALRRRSFARRPIRTASRFSIPSLPYVNKNQSSTLEKPSSLSNIQDQLNIDRKEADVSYNDGKVDPES